MPDFQPPYTSNPAVQVATTAAHPFLGSTKPLRFYEQTTLIHQARPYWQAFVSPALRRSHASANILRKCGWTGGLGPCRVHVSFVQYYRAGRGLHQFGPFGIWCFPAAGLMGNDYLQIGMDDLLPYFDVTEYTRTSPPALLLSVLPPLRHYCRHQPPATFVAAS